MYALLTYLSDHSMHGINLQLCSFAKIREIYTALVLTVFREECHNLPLICYDL